MKNTRQVAVIAAIGLLAFASSNVHAALLTLTIKGSATTQDAPTTNNGTATFTTTKTSVGTQDVLNTLATIGGLGTLPSGSTLVYDSNAVVTNVFTIRNKSGGIIKDVTGSFQFSRAPGSVRTGKVTPSTGAANTTDTFVGTFTFLPGNGNDFSIVGLGSDKFSQSAVKSGTAKVSESSTLSGSGPAHVSNNPATATGTISGKGSETITVP